MKSTSSFFKQTHLLSEAKYVLTHKQVRQTLANVGAYGIAILVGVITTTILIRQLGQEDYARYVLLFAISSTLSAFVGFGYTYASSYLLIHSTEKNEQKELVGISFLIAFSQTLLLVLLLFFFSPLISLFYTDAQLTQLIRYGSVFLSISFLGQYLLLLTKNLNQMYLQAAKTVLQPLLFLLFLFLFTTKNSSVLSTIFWTQLAVLLPILFYLLYYRPSIKNIQKHWQRVKEERKRFGIHMYVSQAFERITFHLDSLMLGKYLLSSVAFYDLGMRLSNPITVVSTKFTDTYLRKFTDKKQIPKRILFYNFIWWIFSGSVLLISSQYIITFLWGTEYLYINNFLFIMVLTLLFRNFYYIYFSFLYNKGVGKEQKKHFYLRGIINLVGNITLIPLFGIYGATLATLFSNIYFFLGMRYEYQKYSKTIST